jgi:hypothetical protein
VEDRELGSKHGQHSGVEDCLMRYDIANTYVHKDRADGRYTIRGSETVGTALCGQATGTGVNQPERSTPQPRYFDAAGSRGNCRVQVVVNDAAPAPKR